MKRERLSNGGSERQTHQINRIPAVNIHHARRYSAIIGLPLNRVITINFTRTNCQERRASHAFRKLLSQRFAPWLRRTASRLAEVPPTYVWTMEAGGRQIAAHWLVHVPKGLQRLFDAKVPEWLGSLFGEAAEPGAVDVRPIYNVIGLQRYILKGIDPAWGDHLKVRPVAQGMVIGKRSGFSKNLGPAARARGGYKPKKGPFAATARSGR